METAKFSLLYPWKDGGCDSNQPMDLNSFILYIEGVVVQLKTGFSRVPL